MPVRFDHLGIVNPTAEANAEMIAFFTDVLALEVSGDATYAEVGVHLRPPQPACRALPASRLKTAGALLAVDLVPPQACDLSQVSVDRGPSVWW